MVGLASRGGFHRDYVQASLVAQDLAEAQDLVAAEGHVMDVTEYDVGPVPAPARADNR